MSTLTPSEIRSKFGQLFCKRLITMVDEVSQTVEIIEECSAKGPVEWDAVNRLRAGGVVQRAWTEGTTLHLIAKIGEVPVSFGPSSKELGGQAIEAVEINGDKVSTRWVGIAGAGLGVAACLPQGEGVIQANYPTEEDLTKVGGTRVNRVTIITPKTQKVVVGLDDTDEKEKGATWVLGLKAARSVHGKTGVEFLAHKLVQLYPGVSWKTTNCVSTALTFAARQKEQLVAEFRKSLETGIFSPNASMAVKVGIGVPEDLRVYGRSAKRRILTYEEAVDVAYRTGVELIPITGNRGSIGALAAVACADMGIEAAALAEDLALFKVSI